MSDSQRFPNTPFQGLRMTHLELGKRIYLPHY